VAQFNSSMDSPGDGSGNGGDNGDGEGGAGKAAHDLSLLNLDDPSDLMKLREKIDAGDSLPEGVFQRMLLHMMTVLLRQAEEKRKLEKKVEELEVKLEAATSEIVNASKDGKEALDRMKMHQVNESQASLVLKNVDPEVPVATFLDDLAKILEIDRGGITQATRMTINEETKTRILERGQTLKMPLRLRFQNKGCALECLRKLGRLKGSHLERIGVGLYYPAGAMTTRGKELEKISYDLRSAAREAGNKVSTSIRWKGTSLILMTKASGEARYKIYQE